MLPELGVPACAGPLAGPAGGHRAPGRGPMRTGGTAFGGTGRRDKHNHRDP
jgi:hypothetical protein